MYINSLVKIKNASVAKKETVKVPFSKMVWAVAEILVRKNLLEHVEIKGRLPKRIIEVRLKNGRPLNVKFLSKPGRAVYVGYDRIKPARHGAGLLILSTPHGIKDGWSAKKEKMGGQLLFEMW